MKRASLSLMLLFVIKSTFAQVNTKLHSSDSLKIFNGAGFSVWGNFINCANSATNSSLILQEGTSVIMYGDSFQNTNATAILEGGEINMQRPRPTPYFSNSNQIFIGNGSSSSIADLTIDNPNNVILATDLFVRDSLKFVLGHLVLNKNDLTLGTTNSGIITGYNQNAYVITNGLTVDSLKGYFIRKNIGTTPIVYPVGHAINDYTPAVIKNNGTIDDFKVRVFDTVYEDGYSLNYYNPQSIPADWRSTKRTWDIRESTKGGSNMDLILQYNTATEGNWFATNRDYAFITHFAGYYPNNEGDTISNWKWDNFKKSSTSTPISPGTITTSTPIATAAMKTRNGITSFSPFAITTWEPTATPLTLPVLNLFAKWDNTNVALLNWNIQNNQFVKNMELQKAVGTGTFSTIKTIVNNNLNMQNYSYTSLDTVIIPNQNLVYRLKITATDGKIQFSNLAKLTKNNLIETTQLFPNPVGNLLHVILAPSKINRNLTIYDMQGKLLYNNSINANENYISLQTSFLVPSTYIIRIQTGTEVYTNKFIKL